jgi:hypothetical protein
VLNPLRSILTILGCGLSAVACSGGGASDSDGPAAPFQFRTSEAAGLSVRVTLDGQALEGASVTVVETRSLAEIEAAPDHGLAWFSGGTDADGLCESVVAIPTGVERVDLVVHHDDGSGPYTEPGLRAHWGPFAPSSRQTVRVADLGNLEVALEGVR